jgi:hypothetical protein
MTTFVLAAAVFLGASAWAIVWRERSNLTLGIAWSLVFTAAAGVLTDSLYVAPYWFLMFVSMCVGGVLLRALIF